MNDTKELNWGHLRRPMSDTRATAAKFGGKRKRRRFLRQQMAVFGDKLGDVRIGAGNQTVFVVFGGWNAVANGQRQRAAAKVGGSDHRGNPFR